MLGLMGIKLKHITTVKYSAAVDKDNGDKDDGDDDVHVDVEKLMRPLMSW